MDAVQDDGVATQTERAQASEKKQRFVERWALRCGDNDVREALAAERARHFAGALLEASEEIVELGHELRHVLEKAAAREPPHTAQDAGHAARERAETEAPRRLVKIAPQGTPLEFVLAK